MASTQRLTGFIINQFNAKEADKVVHLLDSNGEKQAVLVKGVKKSKSRKAHAVDLLNLVEVKTATGVQLPVADDIKLQNNYSIVKKDYKGLCFTQAVCELFSMQAQEGVEDSSLFDLLNSSLSAVEQDNLALVLAFIYLRALKLSGNLPKLGIDIHTGAEIDSTEEIFWQLPVGFTIEQSEQEQQVPATIYKSIRFMEICNAKQAAQLSLNLEQQKQTLKIVYSWTQQIYERGLPAGAMAVSAA